VARQIRESERPQNGTDIEMESTEQNRSSLGNWFGPCSKSGQSAQRSTEGGRKKSRAPRCKAVKRLGPIKNIGCWIPPHKFLLLAVPEPVGCSWLLTTPFRTVEGRALLHLFLVFLVSFRRVPLQQRREYHVAIKAQDIRAGPQRSL
jgi:hypothetical protein